MRLPYRKPGKFSQIQLDPFLTEKKSLEIKKKLERLKSVDKPHAAAEVKRLAEMGDFSENAEYQIAKGRLRGINHRILLLEEQLNRAILITANEKNDRIQIGNIVTVENNGKQSTYQILGSSETKPEKGIISHLSPIGAALLGHQVHDTVELRLPNHTLEYKIINIE